MYIVLPEYKPFSPFWMCTHTLRCIVHAIAFLWPPSAVTTQAPKRLGRGKKSLGEDSSLGASPRSGPVCQMWH